MTISLGWNVNESRKDADEGSSQTIQKRSSALCYLENCSKNESAVKVSVNKKNLRQGLALLEMIYFQSGVKRCSEEKLCCHVFYHFRRIGCYCSIS